MRKRKKRRLKKNALLFIILAAAAAAVLTVILTDLSLRKPAVQTAKLTVGALTEEALSRAVTDALGKEDCSDLLDIRSTGEESFVILADPTKLNGLISAVSLNAGESISSLGKVGLRIDMGSAAGSALLSGLWPSVKVSFSPAGAVRASPVSKLSSAGVNQSLFTVELELSADVLVFLAGRSETVTVKKTVPIVETVIAGRVPQVYTNVADEEDMLNLIPNEVP